MHVEQSQCGHFFHKGVEKQLIFMNREIQARNSWWSSGSSIESDS